MDVWVFIYRLSYFLDDKTLVNLSMVNCLLYSYTNENCIWKRKCLKHNISNIDNNNKISWKQTYIKYRPIYVIPTSIRNYHIEHRDHPTGCFIRVLSSENSDLVEKSSYIISDLDMEYYIIRIDAVNMLVRLVLLQHNDKGKKYYTQDKITKFKIIKRNKLFHINVHIKGTGLLIMPWSNILPQN